MLDAATLRDWLARMGWSVVSDDGATLRVCPPAGAPLPMFVRLTEAWLLVAIVPALPDGPRPDDLYRRLLAVNRDMRLAKFALDEDDDVTLAAELPTEALDYAELEDALARMVRYARHYRAYLTQV